MKAPKLAKFLETDRTDVDCWSSSINLCTYVRGCTLKRLTRSSLTCFIQSQFFNTLIFSHSTVLRLRFTQTSDAASFFVFIFRALRPCDQDCPISACNGNQSTEHPARMTMIEQERRFNSDSFVYWKGKHIFLERKAIENTRPFMRLIEVEGKARVLEEQARIQ